MLQEMREQNQWLNDKIDKLERLSHHTKTPSSRDDYEPKQEESEPHEKVWFHRQTQILLL